MSRKNPVDVYMNYDLASAQGSYEAEFHRRQKAEMHNRQIWAQNEALRRQLHAAAHWAEENGHKELLRIMFDAMRQSGDGAA